MPDNWNDLADWWVDEVKDDPSYTDDVHPMLMDLLPKDVGIAADLGCGEGQGMRRVGQSVIGVDLSLQLARVASATGPTIVAALPEMPYLRTDSLDTAYSVYLVDLIEDHRRFFAECARVVRMGGSLVVIINHPAYTAPGAGPLVDQDGEVLWRWGTYFQRGSSDEPAGDRTITFFHRSLADLLSTAADEGWHLTGMSERGLSPATIARLPGYEGQGNMPRLLGVAWRLTDPVAAAR